MFFQTLAVCWGLSSRLQRLQIAGDIFEIPSKSWKLLLLWRCGGTWQWRPWNMLCPPKQQQKWKQPKAKSISSSSRMRPLLLRPPPVPLPLASAPWASSTPGQMRRRILSPICMGPCQGSPAIHSHGKMSTVRSSPQRWHWVLFAIFFWCLIPLQSSFWHRLR